MNEHFYCILVTGINVCYQCNWMNVARSALAYFVSFVLIIKHVFFKHNYKLTAKRRTVKLCYKWKSHRKKNSWHRDSERMSEATTALTCETSLHPQWMSDRRLHMMMLFIIFDISRNRLTKLIIN